MTSLLTDHTYIDLPNPIDLAEQIAGANDWDFTREGDELIVLFSGDYCDMHFRLSWHGDYKTLQVVNFLDLKIPEAKLPTIQEAIMKLNEQMFIGHFEYWYSENAVLFRHASLASDPMAGAVTEDHLATLIEVAINESNRVYPVFQFIMWGGMNADDAIDATMMECAGSC